MPTFTSKPLGAARTPRFFLTNALHSNARISVSIVVAFVARGLSNIPGDIFCYSAVSSAGVVVILPGFTIRQSIPFPRDIISSSALLKNTEMYSHQCS